MPRDSARAMFFSVTSGRLTTRNGSSMGVRLLELLEPLRGQHEVSVKDDVVRVELRDRGDPDSGQVARREHEVLVRLVDDDQARAGDLQVAEQLGEDLGLRGREV